MNNEELRIYKTNWDRVNRDSIRVRKQIRAELLKRALVNYKGNKCEICNNSFPDCCYDFHHIKDKNYNLSVKIGNRNSLDFLKKEVDKCLLICSNCHRVLHIHENRNKKNKIITKYINSLSNKSKERLYRIKE